MLSNAASHDADSVARSPKSFDIDEIFLVLRDNTNIDIENLVSKIEISESIFRLASIVKIDIVDTNDIIDLLKLDGTETIKFTISRKEPNKEVYRWSRKIIIAKVDGFKKTKPGVSQYTFICLPEYAYLNQFKTISKAVSGCFKNTVRGICKQDLGIPQLDTFIDRSDGTNFKAIIPIMKPLSAIEWLMRNADDGGTPYYFYQTADGKVFLRSKKQMIGDGVYRTYNNKPFFSFEKPVIDDSEESKQSYFDELKQKISKDSSNVNLSKYMTGSEGAFGSTIHKIEISDKKYTPDTFKFDNKNLLNKYQPIGEDSKINNTLINTLTTGKNYFINSNSLAFNDDKNYHDNASSDAVANMYSHKALQDTISQSFTVFGDFELHAGKIINLDLLRVAELQDEDERGFVNSELLSGNHLITSIYHTFAVDGYTMHVEVKKDSFIASLDERRL